MKVTVRFWPEIEHRKDTRDDWNNTIGGKEADKQIPLFLRDPTECQFSVVEDGKTGGSLYIAGQMFSVFVPLSHAHIHPRLDASTLHSTPPISYMYWGTKQPRKSKRFHMDDPSTPAVLKVSLFGGFTRGLWFKCRPVSSATRKKLLGGLWGRAGCQVNSLDFCPVQENTCPSLASLYNCTNSLLVFRHQEPLVWQTQTH